MSENAVSARAIVAAESARETGAKRFNQTVRRAGHGRLATVADSLTADQLPQHSSVAGVTNKLLQPALGRRRGKVAGSKRSFQLWLTELALQHPELVSQDKQLDLLRHVEVELDRPLPVAAFSRPASRSCRFPAGTLPVRRIVRSRPRCCGSSSSRPPWRSPLSPACWCRPGSRPAL